MAMETARLLRANCPTMTRKYSYSGGTWNWRAWFPAIILVLPAPTALRMLFQVQTLHTPVIMAVAGQQPHVKAAALRVMIISTKILCCLEEQLLILCRRIL